MGARYERERGGEERKRAALLQERFEEKRRSSYFFSPLPTPPLAPQKHNPQRDWNQQNKDNNPGQSKDNNNGQVRRE